MSNRLRRLVHRSAPPTTGRSPAPSRVAALVPHFRCEPWLEHCLASLSRQTRPLDGIVVIDDASPEPPERIVRRFPGVTLLRAEANVGPYRLIQQVIDETSYDRYLFQDADDWSAPHRLERLLDAAARTGADLLGSDYLMLCTDEMSTLLHSFPLDANAALAEAPTCHALQHPTSLVSRSLVMRLGGYASGMRFSGDDEFLRRASYVTGVVNVPAVLYFRRNREESLTTSAATGHGSPARRAVLDALADRARANAEAVARGDEPVLTPHATAPPVALTHICGPELDAPPPGIDRRSRATHSSPRRGPGAGGRRRGKPCPDPVLVTGAPASGADALLWALAQHPGVVPVVDLSWLEPLSASLRRASASSTVAHNALSSQRSPQPLDGSGAGPEDLRSALVDAVQRVVLGGSSRAGGPAEPGATLEETLRQVAAGAGAGAGAPACWMATLGPDPARLDAVLELFPHARVIHLVRPADAAVAALTRTSKANTAPLAVGEAGESWRAGVAGGLAIERAVGAERLLRVSFDELVDRPGDVVATCLGFCGLEPEPACVAPLEVLELAPAASPDGATGAAADVEDLSDLSTALCGPPPQPDRQPDQARPSDASSPPPSPPVPPTPVHPTPVAASGGSTSPLLATTGEPRNGRRPTAPATPARVGEGALPAHVTGPATLLADGVPSDAVVAVVTKGEGRFLALAGPEVWHFPRTADGEWAGYHPGTTGEIAQHLEELRERGAGYFLIPSWARWWLDHYEGLQAHMETCSSLVAETPEAGVLFRLHPGRLAATDLDGQSRNGQFRDRQSRDEQHRRGPATNGTRAVPSRRRSVSVISWDMSHNPLGRAHVLAELLRDRYDVELVGPEFERFGGGVWQPLRHVDLPLRSFPGGSFPEHLARTQDFARTITSDAVVVSKPRLPSYLLGMMAKELDGRPLVLDVDDWELSFVGASHPLTVDQLRDRPDDAALRNPYGRPWTQACEGLIGAADRITVSNERLRDRFGGTIVPHARDERLFDPDRFDRGQIRRRFGFDDDERIVMFAGTPRRHKGVIDLAAALRAIGDRRVRLCLIATSELGELRRDLAPYEDLIRVVPYQPFAELPALVGAADIVAVLQDPESDVSRYQMPAKITDALAMGRPCLVRSVPPLEPLIAEGHLQAVGPGGLAATLAEMLDDEVAVGRRARANRELFLSDFSFGALRPRLEAIVEELLESPTPMAADHRRLLDVTRKRFGVADDTPTPPPPVVRAAPVVQRPLAADCFDIVMFWKQHDTGIYGRRHDMLMEHLARSERVGQVVQFDAPVDIAELRRRPDDDVPSHAELIRARTMQRLAGIEPLPGLHQHSFLYAQANGAQGDGAHNDGSTSPFPGRDGYLGHVEEVLSRHHVGQRPTVFWVYPKSFEFPSIARKFAPELVVADVVDDHRTWAQPATPNFDRIVENYEEIVGLSDIVLTNCEAMRATMATMTSDVHLVPNAAEHPDPCLDEPLAVPEELRDLHGPIIGYVGNLSSRIDVELLEHVAVARPQWSIVLIGSAHAGRDVLRLEHLPNVTLLGPRPYTQAKCYVRAFDVGIIPHIANEMTLAMNPLKAFVYCALNIPVVSTNIANLGELRPLLSVADGRHDFVARIEHALRDRVGPLDRSEAAAIMHRNSWTERTERIVALLDEGLRARRSVA